MKKKHTIYLLESGDYYKIGKTTDLKARLKTYETHNPNIHLVDKFNASPDIETMLHKACKQYNYKSEWFYKHVNVVNIFEQHKAEYSGLCIASINEKLNQKIISLWRL